MKRFKTNLFLTSLMTILVMFSLHGQKKTLFTNGHDFTHVERHSHHNNDSDNSTCPDEPYRTIDGTCNNRSKQSRIEWGASDIPLLRTMLPQYGSSDHYNAMGGEYRPSARAVSNAVSSQTEPMPNDQGLSSFVFTWGQFLDHDIDLTPEGHTEYEPIEMPANEPLFTSAIPFFRSEVHEGTGYGDYRQQTNLITSYIDGSNVYGSDQERADWLRTFSDGKLKTSAGNLLPFNTIDGEYGSAIDINAPSMAGDGGGTVKTFVAGDVRAAEQPGLTSLHILFVRYHNSICDDLKQRGMNDDEEIYQKARKEVGATLQAITYNEFLPALGVDLRSPQGYNKNTQADISNIFASAAYRLGHTMVTDELLLRNNQCQNVGDGTVSLLEGFFNPEVIQTYNIAPILKGLSVQVQNEVDTRIIDNLRNFLFGDPSSGNAAGLDLASLNIQRGRDHGLPDYNTVRRHYTGKSARKFRDITRNGELRQALEDTYGDINEIDLWVGLLAEDKEEGTSLGRTLHKIMESQFEKLRDGDRYFYLYDKHLSKSDRDRIDDIKLSDIILANTNLTNIQENVFVAETCFQTLDDNTGLDNRSFVPDAFAQVEMDVFPNPSTDLINVTVNNTLNATYDLTIVDMKGSVVKAMSSDKDQLQLEVGTLSPGKYNLMITVGDQKVSKRFVKVGL